MTRVACFGSDSSTDGDLGQERMTRVARMFRRDVPARAQSERDVTPVAVYLRSYESSLLALC
jgi:hypothetical protein